MKGYKVFNSDWTCKDFQYKVGETYEMEDKPKCCNRGFHFCLKVSDCFSYYGFNSNNKVAEVEALGDIDSESDNSKHCTNKIHILRELTWHEVLDLVNTGKDCTGLCNSGDCNSGDYNSGGYNSGGYNSGDCNSGDYNSGGYNSGGYNSGDCNSGGYNSGDCNSGDYNSGDYNSGGYNSGDCNSGDYNSASFSNGCFNTKEPKIFIFNKLSDLTYRDWLNSDARYILMNCPSNILSWIWEDDMSDEEKSEHSEYIITGGFLKHIEKETGRQVWWDGLSDSQKEVVMNLPNFDKEIFEEITGIKVEL